jgi:hypothetical protein
MYNSFIDKPFGDVVDLNDFMRSVERDCKEVLLPTFLPFADKGQNRGRTFYLCRLMGFFDFHIGAFMFLV